MACLPLYPPLNTTRQHSLVLLVLGLYSTRGKEAKGCIYTSTPLSTAKNTSQIMIIAFAVWQGAALIPIRMYRRKIVLYLLPNNTESVSSIQSCLVRTANTPTIPPVNRHDEPETLTTTATAVGNGLRYAQQDVWARERTDLGVFVRHDSSNVDIRNTIHQPSYTSNFLYTAWCPK